RGRMALFWIFIAVELTLFSRFIVYPLIKLFKLKQGINYKQAAGIIGNFFPEVSDKLLNLLQLQSALGTEKNELLLAGIDQKANELSPIPFGIAIDFRANKKYLVYLVIPVFLVLVILFSGKLNLFSESYSRVVNYAEYYEPP